MLVRLLEQITSLTRTLHDGRDSRCPPMSLTIVTCIRHLYLGWTADLCSKWGQLGRGLD